jgi:hypothetical protein
MGAHADVSGPDRGAPRSKRRAAVKRGRPTTTDTPPAPVVIFEETAQYAPLWQRKRSPDREPLKWLPIIGVLLWTAAIPLTFALVFASQGRLRVAPIVDAAHTLEQAVAAVRAQIDR